MSELRDLIAEVGRGEPRERMGDHYIYIVGPQHKANEAALTMLLERVEHQEARIKELEREARYREEIRESRD